MNVQNMNIGSGEQNNYNATEQNVNHGGDQIIGVNVGRDFVRNFTTTASNPHKTLWDAVAGVGASHKAEQQFSRGECLEGTREEVLQIIHDWRKAKERDLPICWLSGAAGVGKTAIAMTVAKSCEDDGLVSSFFLFRSDPKRNNPSALMLTIAHGLTVTIPLLRNPIERRISGDPRILEAKMEEQFRELVLKPSLNWGWRRRMQAFLADFSLTTREPTLVIIDGLDECSDSATQLRILNIIRDSYQHPPRSPLRFLICSRSESWIQHAFNAQPLRDITRRIVLDDTFFPAKDIKRYLVHEFGEIRGNSEYAHIVFPDPWPSKTDLKRLVRLSDRQFVYVVTAVRFIKLPSFHPMKQLSVILDNDAAQRRTKSSFQELDRLYHVILDANPDHDTILTILAVLLLSPHKEMDEEERTRSPEWLELLLGLSSGEIFLKLRAMHSVLEIQGPKDPIRVHHTSFTDYLFDPTRSGKFYIVGQQYVLAGRWAPALPREIQSGEFHIDDVTWRTVLAERWLQALSREGIGEYSLDKLTSHPTNLFFPSWIRFCTSLPTPNRGFLDGLRNFKIDALCFCLLVLTYSPNPGSSTLTWFEVFCATAEQRPKTKDFLDWRDGMAQKGFHHLPGVSEVATGAVRKTIRDKMNELSCNLLPNCLRIQCGISRLDKYPVAEGPFGDLWRGIIVDQPAGTLVALRVIGPSTFEGLKDFQDRMLREAFVRSRLTHKNIAPFIGTYLDTEELKRFCLVSPWMKNGSLVQFVKNNPNIDPELQYNLMFGVASGLAYLHSTGIIHRGIRGVNILIDGENNACITDFVISTDTPRGSTRWLAPELLTATTADEPSPSSDMYAYACVCYEASQGSDYRYALLATDTQLYS
ncbi:hypothetical protein V5O48_011861 [Marasmius crinis-equi]|uniref:Protein kinase domain-containing protein n=1 Tax=Marasmius crinis-equi TaxID=585013 RepID=A0ABR3F4F1_9AGAR